MINELKGLVAERGLIFTILGSTMFICYIVDVSKGLVEMIQLGAPSIKDIEGITVFFYVPGIFSIMLPALYLGRGVREYRYVFCLINISSMIGMTSFNIFCIALGVLIIAITFAEDVVGFLYTVVVINGFITNACQPLCYEIVAETGFPLSEAATAGVVHALYAFIRIGLKGLNALLDDPGRKGMDSYAYLFVLIILIFMSFVFMFFAKYKYKRLKIETDVRGT